MRKEATAALVIVAVVVSAGAGYLVGLGTSKTSSQSPTYCIQTGLHGSLFVRVVRDGIDNPVSGANVTVTIMNYCSPSYRVALGDTNSSGYAVGPVDWTGVFLVNVTYSGASYLFVSQTSGAASLATLSVPSGQVVEKTIACNSPFGCTNGTATSVAGRIG